MRYLEILGGKPLCGEFTVQGSKNAALPVLAASLLGEDPCVIEGCPQIRDVRDTLSILRNLGCEVSCSGTTVTVDPSRADCSEIGGREAARIRSSILFLGALLGKMGKAVLPYPGGCAIGSRPVNLHLEALERLGTSFSDRAANLVLAEAPQLRGERISLAVPSVGATENTILAAVMAQGETLIEHAAREPEIDELCRFLNLRGARIKRREDGSLLIEGVKRLSPVRYRLGADRIVAGSTLLAAASCGGKISIRNFPFGELDALLLILGQMGARVDRGEEGLTLFSEKRLHAVPYVETAPYPGFPTDLQSPLMAALCTADGESCICETVFENRFGTARQLCRMGARIEKDGRCARIKGTGRLHGSDVSAPDLRGGAALAAAALTAEGRTVIGGYEYIARGYEDICRDFGALGAQIRLGGEERHTISI